LAGFVQSLRATWRTFLLRFGLAFILTAVAWVGVPGSPLALGPAFVNLLAALGRPLTPAIEATAGTTYWVEGATVWTTRSFVDPATRRPIRFKVELWKGYASYDLILFASLILATPGWPLRQRLRLLGIGLALLTLAEFAFFISTIEYSQHRSLPTSTGSVLYPLGYSRVKDIVATWVYYFFQTMGRGLFPLLAYVGVIGVAWPPDVKPASQRSPSATPRRNDPCPCGSGKKYKRCCGKA
jgi:SEC-C motif